MAILPPELVALSREHRAEFLEMTIWIDTKTGERVPLKLWPHQRWLIGQLTPMNVLVKPRQVGATTIWMMNDFIDIIVNAPMMMAVVSHEQESTSRLLNRIRVAHRMLPDWLQPAISHDSVHEMSFPEIGSAIYIGTAGSRKFGRGDVFHRVILSEYAHWTEDQAKEIRVGIQESCPVIQGGRITLESTPNGEGNEFHSMYLGAKNHTSPYHAIFLSHFLHPEYQLPEGSQMALQGDRGVFTPTEEEVLLMRQWNVGLDRIRWRRMQIAKFGFSTKLNRELFLQEYPEDDVSCFRSIAEGIFDLEVLSRMEQGCREPLVTDQFGTKWWGKPLPERSYVLAGDPATGLGEDESVGLLLDVTDYPQVAHLATLAGKPRDDVFAAWMADVGKEARYPMMVVELNDIGQSVLNSLVNQLHYPQLFYQRDPITGMDKATPGWRTTAPSKRIMVTEALKIINGGYLLTYDRNLVKQLRFFKRYPDGSMAAAPGNHDDYPMALMLGLQGAVSSPRGIMPHTSRSRSYGIPV